MSGGEIASIITAIGTLVTAAGVAWGATKMDRVDRKVDGVNLKIDIVNNKVDSVDVKVDTLNESTLGQLGAADETRRIHAKEETGERITDKEQRHIDADL